MSTTSKTPLSAQPEDPEVVRKVDAMMELRPSPVEPKPKSKAKPVIEAPTQDIDIFKDQAVDLKTAVLGDDALVEAEVAPVEDTLPTENQEVETLPVDDPETDAAVDQIAATEVDTLLETQDALARHEAQNLEPAETESVGSPFVWIVLLALIAAAGYYLYSR